MFQALLIRLLIIFIITSKTTSIVLQCQFRMSGWWDGPLFYECEDTLSTILTREDQTITGMIGTHRPGKSNVDVISFYGYRQILRYFPRGIDNYFQNLQYLGIVNTKLMEIHQEDIRPFYNLRVLYLDTNEIEVLEENLFEFNKNLEVININNNRVKFVDVSVFRNLFKLKYLWFEFNLCYSIKVSNDTRSVKKIINEINQNCFVNNLLIDMRDNQETEIINLRAELQNLKNENVMLRNEISTLKIQEVECTVVSENLKTCISEKENCGKELKDFKSIVLDKIRCDG